MRRVASGARSPKSVSSLESHLGYWLRYVSNQVSHAFSLKVRERGVTVAEWVVLRELYDRKFMPSVLADRLGMTRGAISKLADRLVTKGLITQEARAADGRSQMLALTAAGRVLIPTLAALADENDKEFFSALDPVARKMITAAMKEIVRRHGLRIVPVD